MEKLKEKKNWILIGLCIILNLVGRSIAGRLVLPFWLDAIGTLIVAILLGPIPGAITGAMTNLILSFQSITDLYYSIVSIGIGLSIGYYYPRNRNKNKARKNMFPIISTAVFTGLVTVILATPLNMYFYGGRTGSVWGDGLIDMIAQDIKVPLLCSILGEAFVDIPDKALSVLIATGIIKLGYSIYDRRKPGSSSYLIWLFIPVALAVTAVNGINAKAADFSSDYTPAIYSTEDGLATIEINAITQTPDGYIWAGTYAGLYRCDGARFEEMILDERISNVMEMFVDSKGRLWIGTNDSGIVCYNIEEKTAEFYDTSVGLASNAIRAIGEDWKGDIYVGTATQLCVISPEGTVRVLSEEALYGTNSISSNENYIGGVTNSGELFFIDDEGKILRTRLDTDNGYFTCVVEADNGDFMAGTSDNYVLMVTPHAGGIDIGKKFTISESQYFTKIIRSEEERGFFYCCENGLGYISNEGRATDLTLEEFGASVTDAIVDHQGNIWFASNKHGIVRFSWNPFQDVFARADVEGDVTNCVLIKDGLLYIGTNSGLITIDMKTYYDVPIEHPELFKDVRVRDIMEDSKGNVWVSTYGKYGLIKLCPDGSYVVFNERMKGTIGGRFRFSIELSDGTVVASSSTGLNFIKDDEVVRTYGEADGITTQVLTMVETEDHTLLAGSDGDGIYVFKNNELIDHYGQNREMDSQVILRIVPCGDGDYIYVTSNSLYYHKGEELRKLNRFPYRNNYDVFLSDTGDAWISSSAGIFVVKKDDLIANTDYNYSLLNKSRGLYSSLTANARDGFDGENLYLCCADGLRKIPIDIGDIFDYDYEIRIARLLSGDTEIEPLSDGTYVIPPVSGRIQFFVAVLNFTLSNPLLHIYLEGAEDSGIYCQQKEIESLSYLNLPYGEYKLHVQVLDVSGSDVVQEKVFNIRKESQFFERLYFKAYLVFVCILFVLFMGWLIGNVRTNITNAEQWQKEAKVDPMTGFWNKIYSEQELTRICADSKGILMMIDLDNFKPVNDLYGHDNGDKVLTRFADCIRSCTRSEDFIGRVGGDEFIAFIQGTTEESAVAEKARYLNEEIAKVGVSLIGETFSIPLGVSIGGVTVPDEGTDFTELYKKADKALYNVKQNGKHGYDLYRDSRSVFQDSEEVQSGGLAGLRVILGERGNNKGAYLVDFDKLQMVYRLFVRMSKRTIVNIWIVQFMVSKDGVEEVPDEIMEKFVEVVKLSLRSNDVIAPNGKNKVIIIMTETSSTNGQTPIDRIINKWNETPGVDGYTLSYETEDMA